MNQFTTIPSDTIIHDTAHALMSNGIHTIITDTKEEAKEKVMKIIPRNSEVMDMTSVTLSETSLQKEIIGSDSYSSVKKINSLGHNTLFIGLIVSNRCGVCPDT